MKKFVALFLFTCLLLTIVSCHRHTTVQKIDENVELTPSQEKMMDKGWIMPDSVEEGELPADYGVKSVYGLQDNYFDITVGKGFDVALKIIDASTNNCIRYIYVNENTTVTVNSIPQGIYYLKLAYGKDWMEKKDSITLGKFTRQVFYERSKDTFDFGKKNAQGIINYVLRLNIKDGTRLNNFRTQPISERDFFKN